MMQIRKFAWRPGWLALAVIVAIFIAGGARGVAPQAAAQSPTTPEAVAAEDLADPDGAIVEIDGAQIYYVARGPESGPAVLLLHGVLGSTLDWTATIDALAGAGYRVIAFDQPPFGLSDKSPALAYSVAAQADRTIGLMDALGIERAALVGHSAGGPIAGDVAARYPDRVSRLVLVAPAYLGLFATVFPEMTAAPSPEPGAASPIAGQGGIFDLFAVLYDPASDPGSAADQARLRDAVAAQQAAADDLSQVTGSNADRYRFTRLPGWEAGLLAFGKGALNDQAVIGPDVAAISAPVLLVWGEADPMMPLAIGEYLRDQLTGATLVSYPGVGYFPMWEAPVELNRDLIAFLAG